MFSTTFSYVHDRDVDENVFVDLPVPQLDVARWTTACLDNRLMNHLLSLFWTWDNNVEHMIYQPMLEEEMGSKDPDASDPNAHRFCSRFLINGLLALSCVGEFMTLLQHDTKRSVACTRASDILSTSRFHH